jgi:hypothetical protein
MSAGEAAAAVVEPGPASLPSAASWVVPKLGSWPNQMWARFGGAPVYLVGSALAKPHPRDIDLVIVLEDGVFAARYGVSLEDEIPAPTDRAQRRDEHRDAMNGEAWSPGMKRCYREIAGLTRRLHPYLSYPIDLKVRPQSVDETMWEDAQKRGRARLRLDTMEVEA